MAFEDIIGADLALGDEAPMNPTLARALAGHQEQFLRALAEKNADRKSTRLNSSHT